MNTLDFLVIQEPTRFDNPETLQQASISYGADGRAIIALLGFGIFQIWGLGIAKACGQTRVCKQSRTDCVGSSAGPEIRRHAEDDVARSGAQCHLSASLHCELDSTLCNYQPWVLRKVQPVQIGR